MSKNLSVFLLTVAFASSAYGQPKKGYITNIDKETVKNENFRKVLFTGPNSQLVVMSLKSGQDIGKEVHEADQFFRIEHGDGKVIMGGETFDIHEDSAFVIPAGTEHNVINTGKKELKLYTVYSPPEHPKGTIHRTKNEATEAERKHG